MKRHKIRKIKVSNKHEITNTKLDKPDPYRVQVQSRDRKQKLTFAIFQTFMSGKQPITWKKIRDKPYNGVVAEIIKAFKIMMDRDPGIVRELWEFTNRNIEDEELLKEATEIISEQLRK
jgi:hypothetical protein